MGVKDRRAGRVDEGSGAGDTAKRRKGRKKFAAKESEWALILNIQHYHQQLHFVLLCLAKKQACTLSILSEKEAPVKLMNKHRATRSSTKQTAKETGKTAINQSDSLLPLSGQSYTHTLGTLRLSLVRPDAFFP